MSISEPSLDATLRQLLSGANFDDVLKSFYELFGIPIRVFDERSDLFAEVAGKLPPCERINKHPGGTKHCMSKRLAIKNEGSGDWQIRTISCDCGLAYASMPIAFQASVLGKMVFGPFRPAEIEAPPPEAAALVPDEDLPALTESLRAVRGVTKDRVYKIIGSMTTLVESILFSAHKAHVTTEMHIAAVRESYRELTEKNKTLEQMNEDMKEFERLKASFLATVSHELRTPLTSIIGYSDMLSEGIAGDLGSEQQQFVETIRSKGDELLKLISSILDFTQLDTGHMSMQWTLTPPDTLLLSAVRHNQELADRRGIKLALDMDEDLPAVEVDPEKLLTALNHLIENAIKFSSPGSLVRVSARLTPASETDADDDDVGFVLMTSPDMLEIAVEDYGVGISESEQARIFAPFTQLDNSTTREHGGSGLGLAIVKHYVDAHGGKVHVSSRVAEGSTFAIRIPTMNG